MKIDVEKREEVPSLETGQLSEVESDQEQRFGNWVWRAVAYLTSVDDFNPSPRWIANRLEVSLDEVVSALDGLLNLKVLVRTETGYSLACKKFLFSEREVPLEALMRGHLQISNQILSRFRERDVSRTAFLAANQALMDRYISEIDDAAIRLLERSVDPRNGPVTEVFAVTISAVRLSTRHHEARSMAQQPRPGSERNK